MSYPSFFVLAGLAHADAARVGLAISHMRQDDDVVEPPQQGLPRLVTIEVTPEELGPDGVRLDEPSRAKLVAVGADVEQVEEALRKMKRGDRRMLAEILYGAEGHVPSAELEEQLRWYGIAPTEDEEERLGRGETVTFLLGPETPPQS